MDKDYLPAHIATFGLMVLGILAVRRVIMPPLFLWGVIFAAAFSFSVSWFWRNKKPPFLKILVNILILGIAIKAFCSIPNVKLNFSVEFIKVLVLVQLFHSFIISSKRDYALNQLVATILIIFSAIFGLGGGDYYLIHLMVFLLLLIFILRFSVLYERREKCIALAAFSKRDYGITNQLKLSVIFLLILIIVSVLLYPFIPRLDLPLKLIPLSFVGRPVLWDMLERVDTFWYSRDERQKVTEEIGRLKRWYSMRKEDLQEKGTIWVQKEKRPPLIPTESEELIPGPGKEARDLTQDVPVKEERYQEILKEEERLRKGLDEQRILQERVEEEEELIRQEQALKEERDLTQDVTVKEERYQEILEEEERLRKGLDEQRFLQERIEEVEQRKKNLKSEFARKKRELKEAVRISNEKFWQVVEEEKRIEKEFDNEKLALKRKRLLQKGQRDELLRELEQRRQEAVNAVLERKRMLRDEMAMKKQEHQRLLEDEQKREGKLIRQEQAMKDELVKERERQRQLAQRRLELKEELRGLKGVLRSKYQRLIEELSGTEPIAEVGEGQIELQDLAEQEELGKVGIEEEIKPEDTRVAFRWVIFLVTLLLTAILLSIVLFYFFKRLREKYRLKKLALENPKLFIINLYDIVCKIFAIYGCVCSEFMEAKEYLTMVNKKLAALTDDFKTVTDLFLEARYSTHPILVRHSALNLSAYSAIIEKVKQYGKLRQRLLTRFKSINIQISPG